MKEYEELKGVAEAMHEKDDKAQMRIDCSYLLSMIDRLESLEQEMQEQARIIGMGAERELALVAKVESLVKDANECRLSLITQVHELADHIERAAPCCTDVDTRKQMMGQREFALMVSDKWNQNGNPFTAMQANNGE